MRLDARRGARGGMAESPLWEPDNSYRPEFVRRDAFGPADGP